MDEEEDDLRGIGEEDEEDPPNEGEDDDPRAGKGFFFHTEGAGMAGVTWEGDEDDDEDDEEDDGGGEDEGEKALGALRGRVEGGGEVEDSGVSRAEDEGVRARSLTTWDFFLRWVLECRTNLALSAVLFPGTVSSDGCLRVEVL